MFKFLVLMVSFCFACANIPINREMLTEKEMLTQARKSIVKVVTKTVITFNNQSHPRTEFNVTFEHSGSGSIIKQTNTGTMILTAAHVCDVFDEEFIKTNVKGYDPSLYTFQTSSEYKILDIQGKIHIAKNFAINKDVDTCVLFSSKILQPELKLAEYSIDLSEKGYILGFPTGFYSPGYVPIFSGYYIGDIYISDFTIGSMVAIPSSRGASGGPLLNAKGEIVGILVRFLPEFHNLSIATTHNQTRDIIIMAIDKYNKTENITDKLGINLMRKRLNLINIH